MFWFWVILIFVGAIVITFYQTSSNDEKRKSTTVENTNWMSQNDFKSTAEIKYYDSAYSNGCTIYIDENKRQLMISNVLTGSRRTLDFSDILGMEVVEDDVRTNGVGRAIVGGALFGGAGAIVGSNTGKKTVRTVKIVFYLKNISSPKYEIVFSHSNNIKSDSPTYKSIMQFVSRVDATVRAIIAQNDTPIEDNKVVSTPVSIASDLDDEQYRDYLLSGQKVLAIKQYREQHGCDLKEAADYINLLEKNL